MLKLFTLRSAFSSVRYHRKTLAVAVSVYFCWYVYK